MGRTPVIVATAVVVAATGVTFALKDRQPAAKAAETVPAATAEVTRQTLVDRQSKDGTLGYGSSVAVGAGVGGTVTARPAEGATIARGQALYRIDNTPIVLLYGALPAYRTIGAGDDGPDVRQLERNLWALGYRGFTVDTHFSSSTATAVRAWQRKLGLPRTGAVEPGRIRYAAGPVRVAGRAADLGAAVHPGEEILTVTGTARVATVDLTVDDARLAKVGQKVRVTLPAGSTTTGRITGTETVVKPAQGQEAASTEVEVTIGFARQPSGVDQASVAVEFTAAERPDVLTVPVAALLALAEGGYGLQVIDGATTRVVPVTTGLFADGRVEVSGAGLAAGTVVGTAA